MHSLDGEKQHLKGLEDKLPMDKSLYGENSQKYIDAKLAVKKEEEYIEWWQNKVNSGTENEFCPDCSGTLESQRQAGIERDNTSIVKMARRHGSEGALEKGEKK
jgi:hypothetical protein